MVSLLPELDLSLIEFYKHVAPPERNLSLLEFSKHAAPSGARNGPLVHEEFWQRDRSLSRSLKQTHS